MLKKCFKHEWKATWKTMLGLNAILPVLGLLCGLGLTGMERNLPLPNTLIQFLIIAYVVLLMAVSILVPFMICKRYYNSFFSDEGYLTNALPLTSFQKIFPRVILSTFWMIFTAICSMLSMLCLFLPFLPEFLEEITNIHEIFAAFWSLVEEAFSMLTTIFGFPHLAVTVVYTIITALICLIATILLIYFCISVGSLFPSHRILAAVLVYFGISYGQNLLFTGALTGFGSVMNLFPDFPVCVMVLSFPVIIALLGIAAFWVCCWVLDRKLNI